MSGPPASGRAWEAPRPSVVVADDHPLFRVGLAYALRARGFDVLGEAGDGREAVEACRALQPDALLLDVKMPRVDGIEACREVRRLARPPVVAMLTTFDEPGLIAAAREAGAAAWLSKETDPSELAERLKRVIARPDARWLPEVRLPDLTARERDVLELLGGGLSNKAIARELALSPETVKDYLNNLYRKLEVRDRMRAVQRARELGLLRNLPG